MAENALLRALQRCKTDWRILGPLLTVNLVAMLFGWYYYADVGQFDLHHLACGPGSNQYCQPWWWWPLVSDSPNAVLLFFVAALAYKLKGWRSDWLDAVAFVLNLYVGLWTTLLFLCYRSQLGTFDYASLTHGNANPVLFVAHMGMPLQAFVLLPDMLQMRWRAVHRLLMSAGMAVYVAVDYWGPHLHPAPFLHRPGVSDDVLHWSRDRLLHAYSPWLMVLCVTVWLAVTVKARALAGTTPP